MTPPAIARPPLSAKAQILRYAVVITVVGLLLLSGVLVAPGVVALWVPAFIGAGIVTVLLGRSVGPIALLAPLIPAAVWTATMAVLIAVATSPDSDERGLSSLFAALAVILVLIGGEICALVGVIWGAASPQRPPPPAPDQTSTS